MADRFDKSYARRPSAEAAARRDDAADLPEDDPLVELARIVAGNESFDQILGSRHQQPAEPVRPVQPAQRGVPQSRDSSYDLEAELLNDLHSTFDPNLRQPPRVAEPPRQPQRAAEAPRISAAPRAEGRAESFERHDDFDHMSVRAAAPQRAATPAAEPYVATPDFGRGRVAPVRPAAAPAPAAREEADYDDDYVDDDDLRADYEDGDDGYLDEPEFEPQPPKRSRKALITAGVVLLVLVGGGIAALALKGRTLVSGSTPQVIAADQGPTKVEPEAKPAETQDAQQNKLIYDRADPDTASPDQLQLPPDSAADDAAQSNESQASREISRIILPGGPGDQSTSPAVPGEADAPLAESGDDTGPRKVRTVVVKPDGTIVSSEAAPRGATAANDAPAAAAPASPPVVAEAPLSAPAEDAPQMAAPDSADAPLPLSVPAKDNSQLAAPDAAAPPAAEAPPEPAAPAAQPAAPVTGGFVVQVSSQRTEAAAVAAYKNLQKKFPSVLGGREPDIARADLGAKGIYFRARVGPMATRDEAVGFCEQLRAAGGDCIVQKN